MRSVKRVPRQPDKILRSGGGVGVERMTCDERQCFIVLSNCELEKFTAISSIDTNQHVFHME